MPLGQLLKLLWGTQAHGTRADFYFIYLLDLPIFQEEGSAVAMFCALQSKKLKSQT